ncbi:AmmeMemoRadiSam system protein B [Candidatus Uhrbacteria bacterium CG10_big_fil_rev_8_21_14_0_10_48_16]|uniref:AmmeMemoRadiSam system protein B n=1 Tax=Candidatus Uhrbacteria bacterium CG10_big_fil_rev_8_21_14_0_10_48_16 TaxID=1975038 RepID=A0A2M8LGE9_9BACT|nr:MAG: AmmeMemoRadiSam system protein B [Candidatus Uhrbacteria bacterium CG10_big_fil_rev_8_21_14_0_10_48_16]
MICFAGITPHTPLLIPGVGKENLKKLTATTTAMIELSKDLYASRPDVIVVISGHAIQHKEAFSLNLHDEYFIDFKDFGDLATSRALQADLELATDVQRHMQTHEVPLTLDSNASLDYGTGVPLFFFTEKLPHVRILPLSYSGLSSKEHVRYGTELRDVFEHSYKRIAIVASGDLSHCLSSDAPLGFRPEAEVYDQKIQDAVKDLSTAKLLTIPEDLIEKSSACIQEQLLILFGMFEKKRGRVELLSYEHPFGVGYLVAQIHV